LSVDLLSLLIFCLSIFCLSIFCLISIFDFLSVNLLSVDLLSVDLLPWYHVKQVKTIESAPRRAGRARQVLHQTCQDGGSSIKNLSTRKSD
jgi:hypothetical protein